MLGWTNARTTCDEVIEVWGMGWSRSADISVPRVRRSSSVGENGWEVRLERHWIVASYRQVCLVETMRDQIWGLEHCRHCVVTLEMGPGSGMSQC